jgi:hypothetical protein
MTKLENIIKERMRFLSGYLKEHPKDKFVIARHDELEFVLSCKDRKARDILDDKTKSADLGQPR